MTRTLLLFGDSNTHGTMPLHRIGVSGRHERHHRWPVLLQEMLPGWDVITEGHPGRTTVHDDPVEGEHRNGFRMLPALLESQRPIHAVLVMLGTNDLKQRFAVSATDIALSLERIVRAIRGSACGPMGSAPQILVVAPPPIREIGPLVGIFAGGEEKSQHLAAEIGAMCARNGLPFLDAGTLVTVSDQDGIHYEAEAAPILARAFAEAIGKHFE